MQWIPYMGSFTPGQSLSVTTAEVVTLEWLSGHNLWRAPGSCDNYPNLASYNSATNLEEIEATHPGGQTYSLSVPQIQTSTSYCYACTSHYAATRFTLVVSPSVNGIVCIDESVKVLSPAGFVPLSAVTIGFQANYNHAYRTDHREQNYLFHIG